MVERTTRQCLIDFYEGFYSADVARVLDCCHEDFDSITYAPVELFPHLGHKRGKAWVPEAIRTQEERYASRRYELKFISIDGDRAATIVGASLEKRRDSRVVHLQIADFFTLRDGRIIEHRSFFDSFDFVQQVLGQDLTEGFAERVRAAMRS
jgi:ketosteroid isomerase-like protein